MRTSPFAVALGLSMVLVSTGMAVAGPSVIEIPEPSSLALMAAGAGLAAYLKFRRRR